MVDWANDYYKIPWEYYNNIVPIMSQSIDDVPHRSSSSAFFSGVFTGYSPLGEYTTIFRSILNVLISLKIPFRLKYLLDKIPEERRPEILNFVSDITRQEIRMMRINQDYVLQKSLYTPLGDMLFSLCHQPNNNLYISPMYRLTTCSSVLPAVEIIKILLRYGADPNMFVDSFRTEIPLFKGIFEFNTFNNLLEAGGDVNKINNRGDDIMRIMFGNMENSAGVYPFYKIFNTLLEKGYKVSFEHPNSDLFYLAYNALKYEDRSIILPIILQKSYRHMELGENNLPLQIQGMPRGGEYNKMVKIYKKLVETNGTFGRIQIPSIPVEENIVTTFKVINGDAPIYDVPLRVVSETEKREIVSKIENMSNNNVEQENLEPIGEIIWNNPTFYDLEGLEYINMDKCNGIGIIMKTKEGTYKGECIEENYLRNTNQNYRRISSVLGQLRSGFKAVDLSSGSLVAIRPPNGISLNNFSKIPNPRTFLLEPIEDGDNKYFKMIQVVIKSNTTSKGGKKNRNKYKCTSKKKYIKKCKNRKTKRYNKKN